MTIAQSVRRWILRERKWVKLRFAICDDEAAELETITGFLLKFDPQAEYVCFSSARELLRAHEQEPFDLVLLDIEMPELNGFEAAQSLKRGANPPLILLITRSGNYTIAGYEVAFRYLQKPLAYEDFHRAISAAVDKLTPMFLNISSTEGPVTLRTREISYIEVYSYRVFLHTDKKTYECRIPLKQLEQDLQGCGFARPHNSYLVNLEQVSCAQRNFLLLTNGVKLPISRNRKKDFEQALFCFLKR